MLEIINLILRAVGVTGMVMVLNQHIEMAIWEPAALSFGMMVLWGRP